MYAENCRIQIVFTNFFVYYEYHLLPSFLLMKNQLDKQYLENLFNYSNVPIIVWDREYKITRFNTAFEELTGRKAGETLGKPIELLFPESMVDGSMQLIRRTETGHHLINTEINIIHQTGSVHTIIWNSAPVWGADGKTLIATIAQGQDITKCKQAEEMLAQLNQQKDLILSSVAEGVLGLDLQGRHTFVNSVAAKMLGYETQELIGLPSHSIWHHTKADGSSYPQEECPIYEAFRDGKVHRGSEDVFWKKDGTSFPVDYASMPIYEQGKLMGAVVTFTDITERRNTEAALNQSERNMKSFVNDSLLCIYFFNTETKKIIYANPSFCKLLSYSPEEIETLTIYDFLNHAKESVDSFVNHVIETKKRNIGERQWKRKDGKVIDMFVNASYGDHNNSKIIYISAQDISERKKVEKSLVESEARLKRGELIAKFGNWKLDIDRQLIFSSDGSRKIYGADQIELSLAAVKKCALPEYREKMDNALMDLISHQKPYDVEYKIKRVNDETIVDIHSIAEYDTATKTVFGTIQDITERKNAEAKQIAYIKKLSEIAFLQSHQVRSPIASLLGLINLFNFDNPCDPLNSEVLSRVKITAKNLDKVIQEIVKNTSSIEKT